MKNFRAPEEHAARERTWRVVRAAFERRERVTWPRRHLRPVLATAVVAAAVAALLSPPGRSFIQSVRKAVGVQHARTELFSLPTRGRLLVTSESGAWIVRVDGSRRRLGSYRGAAWSPHGLFVAATRGNELVALGPNGTVRWTLARPHPRFPAWTGSFTNTRIAYATRPEHYLPAIRVVGGDGRGDHWVAKDFLPIPPAWRPGTSYVLAVAHVDSRVRLWRDGPDLVGTTRPIERPVQLAWSQDGKLLDVLTARRLYQFDPRARLVARFSLPAPATAMAVSPRGKIALVMHRRGRSEVAVFAAGFRRVFSGTGRFGSVEWSPNGRWLLVTWPTANQWVFVRVAGHRRIVGDSRISAQFGSFPRIEGWCCAR